MQSSYRIVYLKFLGNCVCVHAPYAIELQRICVCYFFFSDQVFLLYISCILGFCSLDCKIKNKKIDYL